MAATKIDEGSSQVSRWPFGVQDDTGRLSAHCTPGSTVRFAPYTHAQQAEVGSAATQCVVTMRTQPSAAEPKLRARQRGKTRRLGSAMSCFQAVT
jgi:hypothetical protein